MYVKTFHMSEVYMSSLNEMRSVPLHSIPNATSTWNSGIGINCFYSITSFNWGTNPIHLLLCYVSASRLLHFDFVLVLLLNFLTYLLSVPLLLCCILYSVFSLYSISTGCPIRLLSVPIFWFSLLMFCWHVLVCSSWLFKLGFFLFPLVSLLGACCGRRGAVLLSIASSCSISYSIGSHASYPYVRIRMMADCAFVSMCYYVLLVYKII